MSCETSICAKKPIYLNVGCGRDIRKDAVNVDVTPYEGVDEVVDIGKFPWPWKDSSIDGIYASHVIEHLPFEDEIKFILEAHRVLKPGGFLRLRLPHSSSVSSVGCFGHYRTFSYNTMDGYLAQDFYLFGKAKWITTERKLRWWYEKTDVQKMLPVPLRVMVKVVDFFITGLMNIAPSICENTWIYWIGGAREVIWKGEKI